MMHKDPKKVRIIMQFMLAFQNRKSYDSGIAKKTAFCLVLTTPNKGRKAHSEGDIV